ncbi:hypothetical protein B5M42_004270 [Paenibacillus athensensis]|uniref:Uncharacterized protein n=1 Tax=Paenibacillus athensensis TaxID=1967502 RepID=A0A4Y8PXF3_9BACL|nr:hypothetical protein [Paenibacillus athensensis]MCD1258053.1 hypothetical protein [Paenibacillus athensensis]
MGQEAVEAVDWNSGLPLLTVEQAAACRYCASIADPASRTPVQCTKFAGSSVPISVNLATCLTCGEYRTT